MYFRSKLTAALTVAILLTATGCAVSRGQETVGNYADDMGITSMVKSRFIESPAVDAASISVETLKGTVMLSGFAKSEAERVAAGNIARGVNGVTSVKNEVAVRRP